MLSLSPRQITGQSLSRRMWPKVKRAIDVIASVAIFVFASPLILVAYLLVKLTSKGPAIFTQRRVGRHGEPFTIYKFRSMCIDAERFGPRWCLPRDNRVTAAGRFLRKTHLDELPQLWNVLRGDMSLIGPRPERPEFLPKLRAYVPNYDDRLEVLPGITGLAQVQLSADTDVENVVRKLRYDLHYIRHSGPWLEVRILFCTVLKLSGVTLRRLRSFMGLQLDPPADPSQYRAA